LSLKTLWAELAHLRGNAAALLCVEPTRPDPHAVVVWGGCPATGRLTRLMPTSCLGASRVRQRSMETINDLMNSTKVDQRFDVRKNARSKVVTKTETLTLIKPIAVCNIGFSTRRDPNFHLPSFCSRSLASDQGETDMRPSSICF
jgi:hypothetical protein